MVKKPTVSEPVPEIRLSNPMPAVPKKAGPSLALSAIFALGMTAIVVPLLGFVVSVSIGWQGGLNVFTRMLTWSFYVVGALLAYGALVGAYHTFLAMTGLDRGRRSN